MKSFNKYSIPLSLVFLMTSCSLSDLVDVDKPQIGADIDHKYLDTRAGAIGLFHSALVSFQQGVSEAAYDVGLLTDELSARPINSQEPLRGDRAFIDARTDSDITLGIKGIQSSPAYEHIQSARIRASHARFFLNRQKDSSLNFAISGSYSLEGYSVLMLAENFCSGIPLSESVYGSTLTYGSPIATDSLLNIAVSKFDSALSYSTDSLRYVTLAKVGKGRALMSLGRYQEAAQTVSDIAPSEVYTLSYTQNPPQNSVSLNYGFWTMTNANASTVTRYRSSETKNMEGVNGLEWYTDPDAIDPRVRFTVTEGVFPEVVRQEKFVNGTVTLRLASWVEARMIEAEHLLSSGSSNWINPLNEARNSVGLPDTTSPANAHNKIDLLFRERAFWFYGQATRLADMRRLVRQYNRDANTVFPIGPYVGNPAVFSFGDAMVFSPSRGEFNDNYKFSGCFHRNP